MLLQKQWVIGGYLSQIDSSQFDSNILQLLGISGRILVPKVTQLFRSKWLPFSFSVQLEGV